ncbi:B2L15 protein, partial [Aegotheles bennettii]|nr:B2L15 protein [Aegotheles bennettii]
AAMATFEEQTKCVVEALFFDILNEDETEYRSLETDWGGPAQPAGELPAQFDPVVIASRLRKIGDRCNLEFEKVSSEALAEVLKGKVKFLKLFPRCFQMQKFGDAVDDFSRIWSAQNPGLAFEMAVLSVSVKLLMHVAKKVPAMVHPNQLVEVINGNSQVRSYIEAHGGWVRM